MMDMVKKAKPNTVIAIHNHPNSSVPSLDDINSAWRKNISTALLLVITVIFLSIKL